MSFSIIFYRGATLSKSTANVATNDIIEKFLLHFCVTILYWIHQPFESFCSDESFDGAEIARCGSPVGARARASGGAVDGATAYLSGRQDGRTVVTGRGMHRWWIRDYGTARWPSDGRVQHRHRQAPGGRAGEARRVGPRAVWRWVTVFSRLRRTRCRSSAAPRGELGSPRLVLSLLLSLFLSRSLLSYLSRSFWLTPCYTEIESPRSPRLLIKSITPYGRCRLRSPCKESETLAVFSTEGYSTTRDVIHKSRQVLYYLSSLNNYKMPRMRKWNVTGIQFFLSLSRDKLSTLMSSNLLRKTEYVLIYVFPISKNHNGRPFLFHLLIASFAGIVS